MTDLFVAKVAIILNMQEHGITQEYSVFSQLKKLVYFSMFCGDFSRNSIVPV
jgi:hypothetical protein